MRYFLLRLYTIKITHLPNFDSLNLEIITLNLIIYETIRDFPTTDKTTI